MRLTPLGPPFPSRSPTCALLAGLSSRRLNCGCRRRRRGCTCAWSTCALAARSTTPSQALRMIGCSQA
eukprot:360210-Chlamydomonas_euryale.AAC.16